MTTGKWLSRLAGGTLAAMVCLSLLALAVFAEDGGEDTPFLEGNSPPEAGFVLPEAEEEPAGLAVDVSGPAAAFLGETLCWRIDLFNSGGPLEGLELEVELRYDGEPNDGFFLENDDGLGYLDFSLDRDGYAVFILSLDDAQEGGYVCSARVLREGKPLAESEPAMTEVAPRRLRTVTIRKVFSGVTAEEIDPNFALAVSWGGEDAILVRQTGGLEESWELSVPEGLPVTLQEQNWAVEGKRMKPQSDMEQPDPGDPVFRFTVPQDGEAFSITNVYEEDNRFTSLLVSQRVSPDRTAAVGEAITYTISVTNTGSCPAENVVVRNPLSEYVSLREWRVGSGEAKARPYEDRYSLGRIPAGETVTLYLLGNVKEGAAGKTITNRPVVFYDNPPAGQPDPTCGPVSVQVGRSGLTVDIEALREADGAWVPVGDFRPERGTILRYRITVKNSGDLPLEQFGFVNTLDPKLELASDVRTSAGEESLLIAYPEETSGSVRLTVARAEALAAGEAVTLEYDARILRYEDGRLANRVTATAHDGTRPVAAGGESALELRPHQPRIFWYDGKGGGEYGGLFDTTLLPESGELPDHAPPEAPEGMAFLTWTQKRIDPETGDITMAAYWTPAGAKITVTWYGGISGQPPLKTAQYPAGTTGADVPPEDYPQLPDPPLGKIFDRWDIRDSETGVAITAMWKDSGQITVTWYDGYSGRILARAQIPAGQVPGAGQYPASPARNGFRFAGWSQPVELAGGGLAIFAQWREGGAVSPPTGSGAGGSLGPGPGGTAAGEPDPTPGLDKTSRICYLSAFSDGTIRPLGPVTRAEAAAIFYQLMTPDFRRENQTDRAFFADVSPEDWFSEAVSAGAKAGLLRGDGGRFYPDRPATRAEFIAMAARFLSGAEGGEAPFADTAGHWAAGEIARAFRMGWIRGDRGLFRPDDPISRAEAAAIVNRMLGRTGDPPAGGDWPDNPPGSWYYQELRRAAG